MKKKIILGSMLVLSLLLLMPSIPAIQQKVVKEEILSEIPEDLEFEDVKELLESGKLDKEKHPILLVVVASWIFLRIIRMDILWEISTDLELYGDKEIHHPFLFLRFFWLYLSIEFVSIPLDYLANTLGWNWNPISDYVQILVDKYY